MKLGRGTMQRGIRLALDGARRSLHTRVTQPACEEAAFMGEYCTMSVEENRHLDIEVRPARPDDAQVVSQILVASYPTMMACSYDAALLARALPGMTRANAKLLASGTYYLALVGGAPVGCGGWTPDEPGTGKVEADLAHIRHYGVDADWAGRGVGRALFERCRVDAAAAGFRRFECFSSLNGVPFYRSLGFADIGPIAVTMGPELAFPSLRMVARI